MIFRQEDEGYGAMGMRPSGHIKIVIRENRGRLDAFFNGLKQPGDERYGLYLVKSTGDEMGVVHVGNVCPVASEAHIRWEFDPMNLDGSGLGIDDWDTAVLLVNGRNLENAVCPLAVYREERTDWRKAFKRKAVRPEQEKHPHAKEPVCPQEPAGSFLSVKAVKSESVERQKPQTEQIFTLDGPHFAGVDSSAHLYGKPEDKDTVSESAEGEDTERKDEEADEFFGYMDDEERQPEIDKFVEILDRDFQKAEPFGITRRDYDWWRVESPIHLNNTLHMCGIRAPLLFNKEVMAAHYKYRHLIAGVFRDEKNSRWFIVCGIPGAFMIDPSPFGNICRWARAGGYRPGYGSMGYWLVYIDPHTGNIIKVS